jgi:hypothetical protein
MLHHTCLLTTVQPFLQTHNLANTLPQLLNLDTPPLPHKAISACAPADGAAVPSSAAQHGCTTCCLAAGTTAPIPAADHEAASDWVLQLTTRIWCKRLHLATQHPRNNGALIQAQLLQLRRRCCCQCCAAWCCCWRCMMQQGPIKSPRLW